MAVIAVDEDYDDFFMVQGEVGFKVRWILDLNYVHNICGKKDWFSFFEECDGKYVILFNREDLRWRDWYCINAVIYRLNLKIS